MEVIKLGTGFFKHNEIDYHISNFDTSNVKFMHSLIGTSIPTETAATSVTTFKYDISGWNVSNVKDMTYMFYNTNYISTKPLTWDVSNVTTMNSMFYMAIINSDINFSDGNVSNVTDMGGMFNAAIINRDINFSDWDVSNVIDMKYMFHYAEIKSNVNVNLSSWVTRDDVDKSLFNQGVKGNLTLPTNWREWQFKTTK